MPVYRPLYRNSDKAVAFILKRAQYSDQSKLIFNLNHSFIFPNHNNEKSFCIYRDFWLSPAINAQLTDSKWRNFMNIPDSYEPIIHFKKDTAILTLAADGSTIETMMYSVSKDRLRLTKVSGLSPCNEETGIILYSDQG